MWKYWETRNLIFPCRVITKPDPDEQWLPRIYLGWRHSGRLFESDHSVGKGRRISLRRVGGQGKGDYWKQNWNNKSYDWLLVLIWTTSVRLYLPRKLSHVKLALQETFLLRHFVLSAGNTTISLMHSDCDNRGPCEVKLNRAKHVRKAKHLCTFNLWSRTAMSHCLSDHANLDILKTWNGFSSGTCTHHWGERNEIR